MPKKKFFHCYLIERIADGKRFVTLGNSRIGWHGLSALYDLDPENWEYVNPTPYGNKRNVPTDWYYNKRQYRVVHQTAISGEYFKRGGDMRDFVIRKEDK